MPAPLLLPAPDTKRRWGTLRHGLFRNTFPSQKAVDPQNGNAKLLVDGNQHAEFWIDRGDCFILKVPGAPGTGSEHPRTGRLLDHGRLYQTEKGMGMSGRLLNSTRLPKEIKPVFVWLYAARGVEGFNPAQVWLSSLCYDNPPPLSGLPTRQKIWFLCLERFGIYVPPKSEDEESKDKKYALPDESADRLPLIQYLAISGDEIPAEAAASPYLLDVSETGNLALFYTPGKRGGGYAGTFWFYYTLTLTGQGRGIEAKCGEILERQPAPEEQTERVRQGRQLHAYGVTRKSAKLNGGSSASCPCLTWALESTESETNKYCKEGYWNWSQVKRDPYSHNVNTHKIEETDNYEVEFEETALGVDPSPYEYAMSRKFLDLNTLSAIWPCQGVGAIINPMPYAIGYGYDDGYYRSFIRTYIIESQYLTSIRNIKKSPFSYTLIKGLPVPVFYIVESTTSTEDFVTYDRPPIETKTFKSTTSSGGWGGTDPTWSFLIHSVNLEVTHTSEAQFVAGSSSAWTSPIMFSRSSKTTEDRCGISINGKTVWLYTQKTIETTENGVHRIEYHVNGKQVADKSLLLNIERNVCPVRVHNEGFGLVVTGLDNKGTHARLVSRLLLGDTGWERVSQAPFSDANPRTCHIWEEPARQYFCANPETGMPEYHASKIGDYIYAEIPCYV